MCVKIKVNIIAGCGAYQGPGKWLFSDIINIINDNIDKNRFDLTITDKIDENQLYDVYHYFHSTLASVNKNKMMHRAIVSIQEMGDFAPNYAFEGKELSLQNAKIVTSPSTTISRILIQRGINSNKIRYVPLGVDVSSFQPINFEDCQKNMRELGIRDDVIRFGIISRRYDSGKKGEDFLMKLIKESFSDVNLYRFMFVGANWSDYLSKAVKEYDLDPNLFEVFEREINCNYEDYPKLYSCMDAVLVTSQIDASPVCILEALAQGLPVISTPTGLANELLIKRVEYNIIGKVVTYGDVYSFTDEIYKIVIKQIDLIRNFEYRQKKSNIIMNANEYLPVSKNSQLGEYPDYTWDSFCKRLEDTYQEVYDMCKNKIFLEDVMNDETQNKFISFYSDQAANNLTSVYMENYEQIKAYAKPGVGVVNFKGLLKNIPTVIVGAGPSLNKNIELLKTYQDKINIFACDAALPILNKNNIRPNVVVVADPSDRQIQNFTGCKGNEFITILPTVVHPMTFNETRKYDCIVAWYNIADGNIELCKWIPKEVGYKGLVRPGVLTSSMVYQIALYMGCSPITFIGHDLSWEDINQGYADGVSEKKVVYQQNNKMFNHPVFLFKDINNKIVTTELSFISFVQWMNVFLREHHLELFNSSGCGILYGENIIQIDFSEWCEKYKSQLVPQIFPLLSQFYFSVKMGNDIPIIPNIEAGE